VPGLNPRIVLTRNSDSASWLLEVAEQPPFKPARTRHRTRTHSVRKEIGIRRVRAAGRIAERWKRPCYEL